MTDDELVKITLDAAFKAAASALTLSLQCQRTTLQVLLTEMLSNGRLTIDEAQAMLEKSASVLTQINAPLSEPLAGPLLQAVNNFAFGLNELGQQLAFASSPADQTMQ